ncbi:MAG TPA: NAD-dependent epimerase/dehydratase family protein [Gaiellaceae bacterium]
MNEPRHGLGPLRVFVTGGGRGFVGGHVVAALEAGGHEVRREWVDVRDGAGLVQAVQGCDAVVHVAALYSYEASGREMHAVNVGGTANVIAACRAAGVRRLVHTSSAGTCGPVPGRAATEEDGPPAWELRVPYKRTKLEAERLVLAAADCMEALCVNPTTPIGEGDEAPTPTGRMVRGVASGRYRATLRSGGLNLVDVHDVARGHVLALERGRSGERYLLGGVNLTLSEVFALIARAAGRRPPRIRLPYAAARVLALTWLANGNEVKLARLPAWFDSGKAQRELGYVSAPIEPAAVRAVRAALANDG